jgi:hypothetical protein
VRYQAALRPDFTDSLDSSAFRETSSLNAARSTGYANASEVAMIYAALDDATQAMAWLEQAYDERFNPGVLLLPGFDPVRSDPPFESLERRVGLGR